MDIFFTGSRSTLGLAVIEVGVILVLSGKDNIKKSLIVLVIVVVFALLFLFINRNNSLGRYLMMQIASVIDTALGTRYSELYGAEIGRLDSSEEYREYLPKIFGLDWLNPIVGRGVKRGFGAEFYDENGAIVYIHSTDNYYVSQYIKYAYPGLIAYLFLIARSIITLFRNGMKYRCSLLTVILIGTTIYFINLWWVDALQTLKFLYAYLALALGVIMHLKQLSNEIDKKSVPKTDT
ncbi:MAG: O-antigen ligase family protein [Lachnospiraceae bacterium]|nr:O-antigen ligase family protein [Lachnospiraceae bacterium]